MSMTEEQLTGLVEAALMGDNVAVNAFADYCAEYHNVEVATVVEVIEKQRKIHKKIMTDPMSSCQFKTVMIAKNSS